MNPTGDLAGGLFLILALAGCDAPSKYPSNEGRPGGPYRMTFEFSPTAPIAGKPTILTERVMHRNNGEPVRELQVLHDRVIHNFIVKRDFSSFAHIHQEDFEPLTAADLDTATLKFPYQFPSDGPYRIVSEFTHRNRSWTKHFDVTVGGANNEPHVVTDLSREKSIDGFDATLSVSPTQPVAGFETELVLELKRGTEQVTDLELILGSEAHVALWRIDGSHFGHTHSYTPHMAAMMGKMHDRAADPQLRAKAMTKMMIAMMNEPPVLVFPGPRIPLRYVFSEPGTYAIFIQCAPGGVSSVFNFMVEVSEYRTGADTQIQSNVQPGMRHDK